LRTDLPHLASRLFGTPLLVDARKLDAIVPAFMRRLNGEGDDPAAAGDYREPGDPVISSGVAIIPIIGTLVRRKTALDAMSGLTSYGDISAALRCALDDARVRAILLQVDSFGGEASGCFELCDELFAARQKKPLWAVADVDAMSAGYAILSQAERCYVAPSGAVGSIGAVAVHCERSQQNEMMGVTYTVIRAGLRKAELNGYEPLTRAAAEKVQASLDKCRDTFVATVVRARPGLTTRAARATEAQWYDADDALRLKLVDAIGTYEAVFAELAQSVAPVAIAQPVPAQPMAPIEPETDDDEEPADELPAAAREESLMDPKDTTAPVAAVPPTDPANNVVNLDAARAEGRAAGIAEVREIAELCQIAGVPGRAAEFIATGKSVADVRKALIDGRAAADAKTGELSNHQPASTAAVNKAELWDRAFGRVHGNSAA
jgi:capsid assembly protease